MISRAEQRIAVGLHQTSCGRQARERRGAHNNASDQMPIRTKRFGRGCPIGRGPGIQDQDEVWEFGAGAVIEGKRASPEEEREGWMGSWIPVHLRVIRGVCTGTITWQQSPRQRPWFGDRVACYNIPRVKSGHQTQIRVSSGLCHGRSNVSIAAPYRFYAAYKMYEHIFSPCVAGLYTEVQWTRF